MSRVQKERALTLLRQEGTIHQSALGGAFLLLDRHGEDSGVRISYKTFSALFEDGLIKKVRTMMQGHSVFHGRVDIYKISSAELPKKQNRNMKGKGVKYL